MKMVDENGIDETPGSTITTPEPSPAPAPTPAPTPVTKEERSITPLLVVTALVAIFVICKAFHLF